MAFDFDALTGHAKGVGITDEALEQVKQAAMRLPYVEVRRSTGGGGLHLRTYLDGIPCENHTVHAALARCDLGHDVERVQLRLRLADRLLRRRDVDLAPENDRREPRAGMIKPATKVLTAADLPANWRDHIEVVTRKRSKVRVNAT